MMSGAKRMETFLQASKAAGSSGDDKEKFTSSEDEEGEELEAMLGQVYLQFLNEELEYRKEESEDGTTRKYDFSKPVV